MGGSVLVKLTNIKERSNGFYAELYVVPKLRPIVGRKVFRENLHTRDAGTALRRRDEAMARLRAKLADLVEKAESRGRFPEAVDWLAVQVAKHREKVAELERQAANERSIVQWAIEQIRQAKPEHPVASLTVAVPTFREAAEQCIASKRPGWRRDVWTPMLTRDVFPRIGDVPVNEVDTDAVLAILQPLWAVKLQTAAKLRAQIESVLDYAKTRGWRSGENPARWAGHLKHVLMKPSAAPRKHHPALPWRDLPAFMGKLRQQPGHDARALELTILTVSRSKEALWAEAAEFNLAEAVWNVPAGRTKLKRLHRVPLSTAAMQLVEKQPQGRYLFPSAQATGRSGRLSHAAMDRLLKAMGYPADVATVHGMRSAFRDWCADTGKDRELAEYALAHVRGDQTERAYARSDVLERRRVLMEQWATFCTSATV